MTKHKLRNSRKTKRAKAGANPTISMSDIARQARKEGKQQAERELSNTINDLEKMLLESTMINKQLLTNVKELEQQNKDQERKYNGLLYDYKHLENTCAATDKWYNDLEKDYKKLKKNYEKLEKKLDDERWAHQWEHA
jgi:valyl-tRNA synthetase